MVEETWHTDKKQGSKGMRCPHCPMQMSFLDSFLEGNDFGNVYVCTSRLCNVEKVKVYMDVPQED